MPEATFKIKNKVGLHARPATVFVREAMKFKSTIMVTCGEKTVNAKSMLSVLTLGAEQGMPLTVKAEGDDAEEALKALEALNDTFFGDPE